MIGVGDGLAIVVERKAAEVMSGEFVAIFGFRLEGAGIGQHFFEDYRNYLNNKCNKNIILYT